MNWNGHTGTHPINWVIVGAGYCAPCSKLPQFAATWKWLQPFPASELEDGVVRAPGTGDTGDLGWGADLVATCAGPFKALSLVETL